MKRNLILLIAAIGIVAISTGCSSQDSQVLENKVSQLEQQLSSQNAENNVSSQSESATNTTEQTSSAPSAQNSSAQQSVSSFDTTELTEKVDKVIQTTDATQPKATYQENVSLYGQDKFQIKQVKLEVDQFEHQIETASRSGAISYAKYQELDLVVEQLDQRLDMSKDSLALRLGVDD